MVFAIRRRLGVFAVKAGARGRSGAAPDLFALRRKQRRRRTQRPTFRIQSNLVVVDVTVRDNKGDLVRDLRKEDFTVYEDNALQEIVNFSLEDIPVAPENPAPGTAPAAPGGQFQRRARA